MTSWHIPRPTGLISAGTRRDVAAPIILILQVKPPPFGKPYERNEELMAMARKNGTYIWNRSELVKICQNVAKCCPDWPTDHVFSILTLFACGNFNGDPEMAIKKKTDIL